MTESFLKFPLFNLVNEEVVLYPIFVHTLKILSRRLHDLKKDEVKKNSANTTQVSLRSTLYLLRLLWSMDVEIWDFLQSNHLPKTFRKGCWFRNSGLFSLSSMLVMGLVLLKQKNSKTFLWNMLFNSHKFLQELEGRDWLLSTCLSIQIWTNNWLILVIS